MSKEYDLYLKEHRENVAKAFYWFNENLPDLTNVCNDLDRQICAAHDQSKSNLNEYVPYDNYFYGSDQSNKIKEDFDNAWLIHIHNNPHHWQYWILVNDDTDIGEQLLDIPINYIIEMICDWWSFSWKSGNLFEIFDWYNNTKKGMKLSSKTRLRVESILMDINKKLSEGVN